MPTADKRAADVVMVPDVVGEHFLHGRDIAWAAGVSLANPDPDGPPIGAIVWPNDPIIQKQDPPPDSTLYRHDALRVWLSSDLEPGMARKLDSTPPSVDSAHAIAQGPAQIMDLTSDISGDKTAP